MTSKVIKAYEQNGYAYLKKDVDTNAPIYVKVINMDEFLNAYGPRILDDMDSNSAYEILGELEQTARCNFYQLYFKDEEFAHADDLNFVMFRFKELRKLENGAYIAYYEFAPNN